MAPPGRSSLVIRPHQTGIVKHHRAEAICMHGSSFMDLFGALELIRRSVLDIWAAHQREVHCQCPFGEVLITPSEEPPR